MPMAWRCPACSTIIQHRESDADPRAGERYRCHACRLELEFDVETGRLSVPRLERRDDAALPERARRFPAPVDDLKPRRRPKAS
jgi:rubredoxin